MDRNSQMAPRRFTERKPDEVIASRTMELERKVFALEVRSNDRGKFLKVTETTNGRRSSSIIVPEEGMLDFVQHLNEVMPFFNEE